MNPGDLAEICCGPGGLVSIGTDDGAAPRDFPAGILCIYLGVNREWSRGRFAYDILIDGAPGWVWQNEIVPVTGGDGGEHESR